MTKLSHKVIIYIIGVLLLFNGGLMLLATIASWLMKDTVTFEMTVSAFLVMILGGFMMLISRNHEPQIYKREGYLIVTLGWVMMTLTGMIPYILTDTIEDLPSVFFETMSGYTATGSTILTDIESLPAGILFLAEYDPLDRRNGYYCLGHCHSSPTWDWRYAVVYCRGSRAQ